MTVLVTGTVEQPGQVVVRAVTADGGVEALARVDVEMVACSHFFTHAATIRSQR